MRNQVAVISETKLRKLEQPYPSIVVPDKVIFRESERKVWLPIYRGDSNRRTERRLRWGKWEYCCPLFVDWFEIRNVDRYWFEPQEIVTEYCQIYSINFSKFKSSYRKISFNTDLPFPLEIIVDHLEIITYSDERTVGTYRELVDSTLLLFHSFEYTIHLENGRDASP